MQTVSRRRFLEGSAMGIDATVPATREQMKAPQDQFK
jgi:hypothetical protein